MKKELGTTIGVIDPIEREPAKVNMSASEFMAHVKGLKKEYRFKEVARLTYPIIDADLIEVRTSNFIIAYIDSRFPTTGGIHEMAEACRYKIPIYLTANSLEKVSSWIIALVYRSGGRLFHTVEDIIDFIKTHEATLRFKAEKTIQEINEC